MIVFHLFIIFNIFLIDFYSFLIRRFWPDKLYAPTESDTRKGDLLNENFLDFATRFFEAIILLVCISLGATYKFVKSRRLANREKANIVIGKLKNKPIITWD